MLGDEERISIEKAARMRAFRIEEEGPKRNSRFEMSKEDKRFSAIETALYLRVFGRGTEGGAETRWVRVLFGEFFFFFLFLLFFFFFCFFRRRTSRREERWWLMGDGGWWMGRRF